MDSQNSDSTHRRDFKRYVEDVLSGRKPSCKWEIAAVERYVHDMERSLVGDSEFPYRMDWGKGEKVCSFVELLPHVKGHWAARRGVARSIQLEPWQKFNIFNIFGWCHRSSGLRRFLVTYISVPRKNAKSTTAAAIGLYMTAADGEYGAEVYCGATTEKQAWEVFRPAKRMAETTPDYRKHYNVEVRASNITRPLDDSRFEPVIGKPGDGASPSCAIIDEYHEHANEELYDTMITGMGARLQPLMLVITTAGSNIAGPCYSLEGDVKKVLEKVFDNERLYGIIYTVDKDDDWTSESALIKANPNYGISVGPDFLKANQKDATHSSRKQNTFKTKHLNLWVTAKDPWMNLHHWERQGDRTLRREDFRDCPCYIGVDLSSKQDIASIIDIYVSEKECGEKHYYVFGRHYIPGDRVEDDDNENRSQYQAWAHDGYLIPTDGNIIDFQHIEDELLELVKGLELMMELGYDPWGATQFVQGLQDDENCDIVDVEVPQNTKYLSEPMKWVDALVKAGRLHHDGNPCMTWMVSNVVAKEDANENIYPRKEKKSNKIDGLVALIVGMSRALIPEQSENPPGIAIF